MFLGDGKSMDCRYSLVVPVYHNVETIPALIDELAVMARDLEYRLEVVFVVDGSPDRSYAALRERLPHTAFTSQLITLSRNFGSFAAIRMGLESAMGPFYAVQAADLQEPPELIITFFRTLEAEPVDITIGTRSARNDPLLQALPAKLFWILYRRLVQPEVPPGGVDVFGCNQPVRDALLKLRESHSTLIGLLFWLGFRRKEIAYERRPRAAGRSGWTLRRRIRYLLDSCFSLTDLPIMLIMGVGLAGTLLSILLSMLVLTAWLAGLIDVPGYTPLILVTLNTFTATMLALGVIGSYVWRTFENSKARPLFVPMMHEMFGRRPPP
jgi:polyisoprenyl-phosphate glycosyltransferase